MFREQVNTVSVWFDRLSESEQTVSMVALLRRLNPTQARFLISVLQRQLSECADLRRAEILANDGNFVASLDVESKETLIRDLLSYLPLLNPKNAEVKSVFLALIPKVLKFALDTHNHMEEARQLLSYSLIHPAFIEDRGLFATWLHQFEEKLCNTPTNNNDSGLNHYPSSCSGSPPSLINDFGSGPWQQSNSVSGSPASQSGLCIGNFGNSNNFHRIRRSNSLTPPVLHSDAWNSQEELYSTAKPRSLSLSSEVSPQSSLASSGSGGSDGNVNDDSRPTFTYPGMKDVPSWLKSLRLHKYGFLFAHLTFEEMLSLTEDMLESQGVTKGARTKIVLSIAKLKERPLHLKKIFDEMTADKESIRNCLSEVKWVLTTPIKPASNLSDEKSSVGSADTNGSGLGAIGTNRFSQQDSNSNLENDSSKKAHTQNAETEIDLTTWIIRVAGKACELNPDLDLDGLLVSVLDKCLSHDAFNSKQKRLLSLWRQQQAPIRRNSGQGHFHGHGHHRNNSSPGNGKHRHFTPRVLNLGNQFGSNGGFNVGGQQSAFGGGNSSIQAIFMSKRPSLQDSILESSRSHLSVQRTKSAPLTNFLSLSPPLGTQFASSGGRLLEGFDFSSLGSLVTNSQSQKSNQEEGNNNQHNGGNAMDINIPTQSDFDLSSRLESLCLSMTEAALQL